MYKRKKKEVACYKLKRYIKQRKLKTAENLNTKYREVRFVNIFKVKKALKMYDINN